MRVAVKIELSEAERQRLERLSRSRSAAMRLRERSRIVLMAAGGMTNKAIAQELGTDQNKVGRWRRRFADEGLNGIAKERPRGGNHGGKNSVAQAALRREVIRLTTQTEAPDGTHWSCRSMARAAGTTHSFVHRVWRSCGLKPHLVRTFKLSTDPRFEEKLQDVVGLYLDPPDNVAVDRRDLQAASPPGGAEVPAQGGKRGAEGPGDPHHPGQLLHPQARQGAGLDRAPEAGLPALHADQRVVAEPLVTKNEH